MARVLFVTTSYPARPGDPSGHFVRTEARLQARAGHRITVLAPATDRCGAAPSDGIIVHRLRGGAAFGWPGVLERLRERPARALGATRFVLEASLAAARLGPFDEVVAHWFVPSAWPIALCTSGRLEVVVHGSDVAVVEALPRAVRHALAASLLSRGASFRFVSRDLETRFARATTRSVLSRSRVEPCAIDVACAPPRAEARARFGIGRERLAVVVGRLVASKDPLRAVRLAVGAADRVVVVGDGPLAERVRTEFPRVTLAGALPRPDALAWIAAADLLVSASVAEGASTVVREARALGTAVLAVPAGDIAERALHDPGITLVHAGADGRVLGVTRGSAA